MRGELDFYLNELVNYFPGRIDFPSEKDLFSFLTQKSIISASNYKDFEDFVSYQNPSDLIQNINSPSSKVSMYCIYACSFFKKAKCEDDILSLIDNPDKDIRAIAIFTIGELQFTGAAPTLLTKIDAAEAFVKNEIIITLGKLKYEGAIQKLNELLKDEKYTIQSLLAIARIGQKEGLKTLVGYIRKGDKNSKCMAIYASVYYNSTQLNDILLKQLEIERQNEESDDNLVINAIVFALGYKRCESAVKTIIKFYVDKLVADKVALQALYTIAKKNIDIALSLLKDSDSACRLVGAKLLGMINNKTAVIDLIEAYNNEYIFTLSNVIKDIEDTGEAFAFDDIFILEELIVTIAKLGGSEALITVDKACVSEHGNVAEVAKEQLIELVKNESVKTLVSNITNLSDSTKIMILRRLNTEKLAIYTDTIFEYINDNNKDISFLSALYLGKANDNRAIGKLSEIVAIKNDDYATDAKSYLDQMGFH